MGHSLEAWLQLIVVEGQSTGRERSQECPTEGTGNRW
jgi:hypothetical protein